MDRRALLGLLGVVRGISFRKTFTYFVKCWTCAWTYERRKIRLRRAYSCDATAYGTTAKGMPSFSQSGPQIGRAVYLNRYQWAEHRRSACRVPVYIYIYIFTCTYSYVYNIHITHMYLHVCIWTRTYVHACIYAYTCKQETLCVSNRLFMFYTMCHWRVPKVLCGDLSLMAVWFPIGATVFRDQLSILLIFLRLR